MAILKGNSKKEKQEKTQMQRAFEELGFYFAQIGNYHFALTEVDKVKET